MEKTEVHYLTSDMAANSSDGVFTVLSMAPDAKWKPLYSTPVHRTVQQYTVHKYKVKVDNQNHKIKVDNWQIENDKIKVDI